MRIDLGKRGIPPTRYYRLQVKEISLASHEKRYMTGIIFIYYNTDAHVSEMIRKMILCKTWIKHALLRLMKEMLM